MGGLQLRLTLSHIGPDNFQSLIIAEQEEPMLFFKNLKLFLYVLLHLEVDAPALVAEHPCFSIVALLNQGTCPLLARDYA